MKRSCTKAHINTVNIEEDGKDLHRSKRSRRPAVVGMVLLATENV